MLHKADKLIFISEPSDLLDFFFINRESSESLAYNLFWYPKSAFKYFNLKNNYLFQRKFKSKAQENQSLYVTTKSLHIWLIY